MPQFDHLCSRNTPPADYDHRVDETNASTRTSCLPRGLEQESPLEAGLNMIEHFDTASPLSATPKQPSWDTHMWTRIDSPQYRVLTGSNYQIGNWKFANNKLQSFKCRVRQNLPYNFACHSIMRAIINEPHLHQLQPQR